MPTLAFLTNNTLENCFTKDEMALIKERAISQGTILTAHVYHMEVSTYKETKKLLRVLLNRLDLVTVYRTKRGQLGLFYEIWKKIGKKIEIDKQGLQ
jgi:hypothetical protein